MVGVALVWPYATPQRGAVAIERETFAAFPRELGDWRQRGRAERLDPDILAVLGADDYHSVRFVKDEDGYLRKVDRLRAGVIKESAWRCNEDLHAGEQHLLLWRHGDAAVDNTTAQREVLPVGGTALGDLHGELARWRQNKCANGVTRWAR